MTEEELKEIEGVMAGEIEPDYDTEDYIEDRTRDLIAEVRRLRDWQKRAAPYLETHMDISNDDAEIEQLLLELPKAPDGD